MAKAERAEAIKEFIEKLRKNFITKIQKYYCIVGKKHLIGYLVDDVWSNIDNTLKEMVGENNETNTNDNTSSDTSQAET